jgi:hypothetical protein
MRMQLIVKYDLTESFRPPWPIKSIHLFVNARDNDMMARTEVDLIAARTDHTSFDSGLLNSLRDCVHKGTHCFTHVADYCYFSDGVSRMTLEMNHRPTWGCFFALRRELRRQCPTNFWSKPFTRRKFAFIAVERNSL